MSDYEAYDYSTVADDAYNVSADWSTAADHAYVAGDTTAYSAYHDQAYDWGNYSTSMEYVASDPTDASAWSSAYSDASSASWDAWSAGNDAYAAGDYALADQMYAQSHAAEATANATWDAWDANSVYNTPSPTDYTAAGGAGDASLISSNDMSSVL